MKLVVFLLILSPAFCWASCLPDDSKEFSFSDNSIGAIYTWKRELSDLTSVDIPLVADISSYRNWYEKFIGFSQIELVQPQMNVYERYVGSQPSYRFLLDHMFGDVHQSCLDAFLFSVHFERNSPILYGGELEAFILANNNLGKSAVLFASGRDPGIGPFHSKPVKEFFMAELENYLKNGYQLKAHLHSHPINVDPDIEDIGGTLLPSGCSKYGDISAFESYFKKYQLKEAWITNGYNTNRFNMRSDKYKAYVQLKDESHFCNH